MEAFIGLDKLWVQEWELESGLDLPPAPARRQAIRRFGKPAKRPKLELFDQLSQVKQESQYRIALMRREIARRLEAMEELKQWRGEWE